MSARGVLRVIEGERLGFWCPGCDEIHVVSVAPGRWTFNGDFDRPTFSPSVLVTGRRMTAEGRAQWKAWCDRREAGKELPLSSFASEDIRCHSFVREGRIEFLTDCTHALAGQTVPLVARADPC